MRSNARIGDHPLHPMLVGLPIGSFVGVVICQVLYMFGWPVVWWEATKPLLAIGVVSALLAAVPGFVDLFTVAPRQGAGKIATTHMVLNLFVVIFFGWAAILHWQADAPPAQYRPAFSFWITILGLGFLVSSGWLGARMVYKYHVGVLEHPESADPSPAAPHPPANPADRSE